jgi:hypothetical protein
MHNSIKEVTSIAAAAAEILEGKVIKISTLPIDNLAGELETLETHLKVMSEDIADLETIQKDGIAAYKKLKSRLEAVKKHTDKSDSHSAEVNTGAVADYHEAAARFLDVFEVGSYDQLISDIVADKKEFDRSLKFVKTSIKSLDKVFND